MQDGSFMTVIWILLFFSGVASWVIVERRNYPYMQKKLTVWAIFWASIAAGLVILYITLKAFFGSGPVSNPFTPPPGPTSTPTPQFKFGN